MPESLFEKLQKQSQEEEKEQVVVSEEDGQVLDKLKEIGDQKQVNPPIPEPPAESMVNKVAINTMIQNSSEQNERKEEPKEPEKTPCPQCGKEFLHLSRHKCKEKPSYKEIKENFHASFEKGAQDTNTESILSKTHLPRTVGEVPLKEMKKEKPSEDLQKDIDLLRKTNIELGFLNVALEEKLQEATQNTFTLVLDAVFLNQKENIQNLDDLLKPIEDSICQDFQIPHWSLMDYGKGPGTLAARVESWIETNPPSGVVLADSRAPNTKACLSVLKRHAGSIIQGVR